MNFVTLFIILISALVKNSFGVRCNTNPCELDSNFLPPNYNCIQLPNNFNDVICTCPDGQGRLNARCRICDSVDCGPNGVCIEKSLFTGLFYACGCTNGTDRYANPGPCPGVITTTITTTTVTTPTPSPINCLNGGIYNVATANCVCRTGFTGSQCETSIGQELCRSITCVKNGVCNPVPTANNEVEAQCWCLSGFSGPNCELIGTPGRCASNFCQNRGLCEEKRLGNTLFAYCQCLPGFTGRFCESHYFTCPYSGLFLDSINCKFGRYFQCVNTIPIHRSCSKGLRFNSITFQCDSNGSCPS